MAQTKDEKKRIAIRDAAIADVVEHGLGNALMSRIASKAGVSAGTIYLYYPNKELMLQSVYLEIKRLLGDAMIGAFEAGEDAAQGLRGMWFAMFDTMIERPDMFLFHEVISAEGILDPDHEQRALRMAREIRALLQSTIDDGTVKTMPIDCLASLYFGPATNLVRRLVDQGSSARDRAETVYGAIWAGIKQ